MHLDVVDLMAFYRTPLGLIVRQVLRRRLRLLWPDVKGQSVLGLGFATPFLRPFKGEAERVLGLMPAGQGVCNWPPEGPPATALFPEDSIPLPDASVQRVLMVHALENSEAVRPLLREVWRILAPQGQVLLAVPNRASLWARREATPFGFGRPYSRSQLEGLLRDSLFAPEVWSSALFVPPLSARFLLRGAAAWEAAGQRWWPGLCGLHLVQATKQVYAMPRGSRFALKPVRLPAGGRMTAPVGRRGLSASHRGE